MRIIPLGGAEEIGASCTLVETGGHCVVIDCGVRMGGGVDPLPNLAALSRVDAVVVTHAHLDHSGALPLLHRAFPAAPVYATPATHALLHIMLMDAVKVMADRTQRELEVPLYEADAVSALASRFVPVRFCEPTPILDGMVLTLFPAGHILGASMVALEARDGKLLATGDYSVAPQRTVEGLMVPRFRPDVLITESTYGCRLHANRKVEERRLAEAVAQVVEGGGKALVPAFALGRAQEVLLILQQFQRDGQIPRFPIWVDGMVKNICGAYTGYAESLSRPLRRRLQKEGQVFFNEQCIAVPHGGREKVLQGGPSAIVASSGMLTGGPSLTYAQALASDTRSAIFLTGYQDEESPGRHLLTMASAPAEERRLTVDGRSVLVSCQVGQYGLSAHADSAEMAGLVSSLSPRDVVLVHGDDEARRGLARMLADRRQVWTPSAGDELVFDGSQRRTFAAPGVLKPGLGRGRPLDPLALRDVIFGSPAARGVFTLRELAELWHGRPADDADLKSLQDSGAFEPDRKRPFLFRAAEAVAVPVNDGPMEQNRALAAVDEVFAGVSDLYRKGAKTELRVLVLSFHFPTVAARRYEERIAALRTQTGWNVELNLEIHLGALQTYLASRIQDMVKAPSYRREEGVVLVRVAGTEDWSTIASECQAETGLRLIIEQDQGTPLPQVARRVGEPMEINAAYAYIEKSLPGLHRKSKKMDVATGRSYIELSFVSPQVGQRHRDTIAQLADAVGWTLRINPEPNQNAIKDRVRQLLGEDLAKEPGFFKEAGCVRVRLRGGWPADRVAAASDRLEQETGYRLEISG